VTGTARESLLDPTGESDLAVDTALTPRLRSLRGLRVGLLDNTKPNGAVLLRAVGRQLQERHGVREVRMFVKGYFGTPVEESVVQQILRNSDFAVAGIGD
jgi:predicted component of type VI protein secretion system